MSEYSGRWLGPRSILVIRREGGVAFFPGLEAPRRIECRHCSEEQRQRLDALLTQLQPLSGKADGADRRHFMLWVEDDDEQSSSCEPGQARSLILAEEQAPEELVALWKQAGPRQAGPREAGPGDKQNG